MLTGLTPPPGYFPQNVLLNISGSESLDQVLYRGHQMLTPQEFADMAQETGALILDTRAPETFCEGFIPNSINIGLDGAFAVWAGTLIPDVKQEILLVADAGREDEAITRLARVGFDGVLGVLKGSFENWKKSLKEYDTIQSVTVEEMAEVQSSLLPELIDVRKKSEFDSEHIIYALNAPLDYINESMKLIDKNKTCFVYCAGGYRSVIFISILRARGFDNLINVKSGMSAIKKSGLFELSTYHTPITML